MMSMSGPMMAAQMRVVAARDVVASIILLPPPVLTGSGSTGREEHLASQPLRARPPGNASLLTPCRGVFQRVALVCVPVMDPADIGEPEADQGECGAGDHAQLRRHRAAPDFRQ